MPLTLSNILLSPIIIFTSLQTMPVLLISPSSMQSALPAVYLAFNQFGAGHYDAVISNDVSTNSQAREPVHHKDSVVQTHLGTLHRKRYCGRKSHLDKSTRQASCIDQKHYASRCPCYKNQLGCRNECSCRKCENPFGKRGVVLNSPLVISPPTPRKRAKHFLTTTLTSGKEFMQKMEANIERVWNRAEIIVFECLTQLLPSLHIILSDDNVQRYFNKIARRICQLGYTDEIIEKSLDEIQLRIRAHDEALKRWLNGYYQKEKYM